MKPKTPHIAFISPGLYPHVTGGMEIFNYYLILELSKYYKITVFSKQAVDFPDSIKIEIVSPKLFGISGFKLSQLWFVFRTYFRIKNEAHKFDVIHIPFTSNGKYLGLLYPCLTQKLGIPYVVSIHGGGLRPWKPKWIYARLFKTATRVVAVSDVIKKEYEHRTGKNVSVILPLIPFSSSGKIKEENRRLLDIAKDDFVILFLGTLKELKRPIDILMALNHLGIDYLKAKKIKMLFVGDGNQRKELESFVREKKLQPYVLFVGQVPFEETAKFYEVSDLYIISSRFEGTSKSFVGALHFNVPVIGSDVGGINNVITHNQNGLLYPLCDYERLADSIKLVFQDKKLRFELAKSGKNTYLERYSFAKTVKDFKEIYNRVINQYAGNSIL